MKLSDLKINQSAKVKKIDLSDAIKNRLTAIGVVKGAKITIIRRAPFGDPIEIKVRDFYLAIRKSDAQNIVVEQL